MDTVTMTLEQYKKLEYALTLAQYFCEGRDPCEQLDRDQETVDEAMEVIEQIDRHRAHMRLLEEKDAKMTAFMRETNRAIRDGEV
jgi:hypothetical protein